MIHWLQVAFSTYAAHPLRGAGYQFWSGIGSDFGEATILAAILGTYKHHTCNQPGCLRLGHRHPEHGRPVCRKHYHHDVTPAAWST